MDYRKYDHVMMETCDAFAKLSKCSRKKVGAVIAKEGRIISTGYNGTPTGWKYKINDDNGNIIESDVNEFGKDCGEVLVKNYCPNCDKDYKFEKELYLATECPVCKTKLIKEYKTNHSITLHAEANAILWAGRKGISCEGATLYCTYSPCTECSKLIMQAGIVRVVYKYKYQDVTGLYIMEQYGIIVEQYKGE